MNRFAQILSTGSYVPKRVVTNAEIDEILGEPTSEWLIEQIPQMRDTIVWISS